MTTDSLLVYDNIGTTAARVSHLVTTWTTGYEVSRFAEFPSLAEAIESDGDALLLVAALSEASTSQLNRVRVVHEECPALPIVLVLPEDAEPDAADLVRVGAVELLSSDCSNAEMGESLERALRIGRAVSRGPQSDTTPSANTVAVLSPVGGAGRSFLAANLAAWECGRRESVCLVDLAGPFGSIATALRLRADYTVTEACRATEDDASELSTHLREYMTSHNLGFDVLAAPRDPGEWWSLSPASVHTLIDLLGGLYEMVVIDAPSGIDTIVTEVVGRSTSVYVVSVLDVPGLRAARLFLEQLEALGVDPDQTRLLINKAGPGLGLEREQATDYLGDRLTAFVPTDDEVVRSINHGRPIVVANPKHRISRLLDATFADQGSAEVTDIGASDEPRTAAATTGKRLARRLLNRAG